MRTDPVTDFPMVRPAAVAGAFYPGNGAALEGAVDAMLAAVNEAALAPGFPKALIVPHAGYAYSGPIAANAYARLRPARGVVNRVVLLGPSHRVRVRGLALPGAAAFETPLGRVPVDRDAVAAVSTLPQVHESATAHSAEHSLEVQIPFLQRLLGDFALVPFVVGDASPHEVAEVIERLWGGPETVIIVSSDLSHYRTYADACAADTGSVRSILALSQPLDHEQACGATPIAGLVEAIRRRGLLPQLVDLRNSGDTAGDRDRVVGYASIAFWNRDRPACYDDTHGRTLLALARAAILDQRAPDAYAPDDATWLAECRATFVTLRQQGELRGCVGSLAAHRALANDVAANARAAAFHDPRFAPLTAGELDRTEIEVSLLSATSTIEFSGDDDLRAKLVPGVDGIVLSAPRGRATFLPQVWDQLPEPAAFIAQLKRKAGIAADFPLERCTVQRYSVHKWIESAAVRA